MWRPDALRVKPSGLLLAAAFLLLSRSWLLPASLFTAAACHELAHWLTLRALHAPPRTLILSASGASMYVPSLARLSYGGELLAVAAGPVCNLLLWVLLSLLSVDALAVFAGANLLLGALNLLPVRPMDGGRILWLSTAYLTEPYTADRVSAAVGLAASSALFLLCLYLMASTGSGLFLLLGALWLTYRSLPPQIFLPRRLAKPAKNR